MGGIYANPETGATSSCGTYSFSGTRRLLLERFWAYLHKTAQRQTAANESRAALEHARRVEIHVTPFPSDLRKRFADHLRHQAEQYERDSTVKLPRDRIVSMLRHEYTNYEGLLASLENLAGRAGAARIIKKRVNEAIHDRLAGITGGQSTTAQPGHGLAIEGGDA